MWKSYSSLTNFSEYISVIHWNDFVWRERGFKIIFCVRSASRTINFKVVIKDILDVGMYDYEVVRKLGEILWL